MQTTARPKYVEARCLAAILWLVALIFAQGADTWTSKGLEGGEVYRLAMDPANSSIVYALTTPGGLSKSTDGDASWQA